MSQLRSFFDPEAPGIRGTIGLFFEGIRLIWEYIRSFVSRVDKRVRALTMIAFAGVVLMLVTNYLAGQVIAYAKDTNGPFLGEALLPSYEFTLRPVPPLEAPAEQVLPATAAGYRLNTLETSFYTAQNGITPALGLLSQCLLSTQDVEEGRCGVATEYHAMSTAVAVYYPMDYQPPVEDAAAATAVPTATTAPTAEGEAAAAEDAATAAPTAAPTLVPELVSPVHVIAARFLTPERATDTLFDMRGYARTIGRIGSFAHYAAGGSVDYFQSSTRGWFSYSWTRNNWIFTVSARDYATLDMFMQGFPY